MKRNALISVVLALDLALAAVLVAWAWIEGTVNPDVVGNNIQIAAAPGLIIELNGAQTDSVNLNDFLADSSAIILAEASSVDGEKIFIRQAGGEMTEGSLTENTIYLRDAESTDKNSKYIDLTFHLKAVDQPCDVYFDAENTYVVKANEETLDQSVYPIRIFLDARKTASSPYMHKNDDPSLSQNVFAVFPRPETEGPTIAAKDYNKITYKFEDDPTYIGPTYLIPLSTFNSTPWLSLAEGEDVIVCLRVWFEGCDEACLDEISGGYINLSIKFVTEPSGGASD